MANGENNEAFQLNEEARRQLESMKKEIDDSKNVLADLEELGIDTSKMRERVEWAEKARDILLKHV